MKKILTLTVCMTFAMLTLTALGQTERIPKDTSPRRILARQVSVTNLDSIKISDTLREAFGMASVAGGIVTIPDCRKDARYTLMPTGLSLRNVLDAVVSAEPRYKWQVKKGIVNLIPRIGLPELLNLRISDFKIENAETVDYALSELLALPEVKRLTDELNLKEIRRGGIGYLREEGDKEDEAGFSVSCKNVTLREALNAIVRAHGRAVWVYWERRCDGQNDFSIELLIR